RTLLMQGRALRRAGRKREARAALGRGAELLEESGAALFALQARAELLRIPGRRPGRPGTLTEGERRIAEAVSEGRSNKEVAAQLFLSVKTVELTLTRVYRKLGVRNRAELAARFPEIAGAGEVAKE
ncbi:MAG TPA: LuxR C-terminal-related transcriptional regulator, partial [Gaiellaceae bacterium]|nr:LuxR C-terminal-related transcriptional regulator [Gaiellaceae bacterium]